MSKVDELKGELNPFEDTDLRIEEWQADLEGIYPKLHGFSVDGIDAETRAAFQSLYEIARKSVKHNVMLMGVLKEAQRQMDEVEKNYELIEK